MKELKSQIILQDGINYFDWTASGLAHKDIESQMLKIMESYSNTHSECGANAKSTSELYEKARSELKVLLGLNDDFYLLGAGFGSTGAIKKFWELMGVYISPALKTALFSADEWQERLKNAPIVITGPYEHHSNELHLRYSYCQHKRVGLDKSGGLDFLDLENKLKSANESKKQIFVSISAASNVTGVKTNTAKLKELVSHISPGAIIALDASSLIAHENIPSEHFDVLFLSPHKLLGGPGACGVLALRKSVIEKICAKKLEFQTSEPWQTPGQTEFLPTFAAGGTVEYVSRSSAKFVRDFERLEDAGTPPITQLIRAYLAFKLRDAHGLENIKERENALMKYFEAGLAKIPFIKNYCPPSLERAPIYAFNCEKIGCYDFAKMLSQKYEIQARAGCSCAGPYGHDLLGLDDDFAPYFKPGWVRVSLHYSQDFSDIDYLLGAIKSCVEQYL